MKIVKFGAEWCNPCKQVDEALKEAKIEYEAVDIEKDPWRATEAGIRQVPVLFVGDTRLNGREEIMPWIMQQKDNTVHLDKIDKLVEELNKNE